MNSGPVARWLDTFVCNSRSYADLFKQYGFDTLNDVCKLDIHLLLNMGISQMDSEKIMDNVSVLRQTLKVSAPSYQNHMYATSMRNDHLNHSPLIIEHSTPPPPAPPPQPAPKASRRSKAAKANAEKQKQQQTPNVTLNQGTVAQSKGVANAEVAKKIGNDIVMMANSTQASAHNNYTYMPVCSGPSNGYYQSNQSNVNYDFNASSQPYSNYSSPSMNVNQHQQQHHYSQQYNMTRPNHQVNQPPSGYVPQSTGEYYTSSDWYNGDYSNGNNNTNTNANQPPSYHSNYDPSYQMSVGSKNSPLEYLERLAQLPECQVVDPKSIVNNEANPSAAPVSNDQYSNDDFNKLNNSNNNNNKRNFALDTNDSTSSSTSSSKKQCTSNSKQSKSQKQQQQYAPIINNPPTTTTATYYSSNFNTTNDSPTSSCSSTSSFSMSSTASSSTGIVSNSNHNQSYGGAGSNLTHNSVGGVAAANLMIDACNFEFLDYLPELNSNTIDQTITSVIGSTLDNNTSPSVSSSSSSSSSSSCKDSPNFSNNNIQANFQNNDQQQQQYFTNNDLNSFKY